MKLKFTLVVFLLFAGLVGASAQSLWGVTSSGVADNKGVVFKTSGTGTGYTVQNNFISDFPGSQPFNSLTLAPNGKLYGMTSAGGANEQGIIFEFDPTTGNYTNKFDFTSALSGGTNPQGGFVLANGLLYGMTTGGGASGDGTLFSYSPGATTIVKKFDFTAATNGSAPTGTLVQQSSDSHLYGLTTGGGTGNGVLFEYDPATSSPVVRHVFSGTDGSNPPANLVEAFDGQLYGMTLSGGSGNGTLFEYNPVSHVFTKKLDFTGPNGSTPYGSLVANVNGTLLYGMTSAGGATGEGTIFSYGPGGTSVTTEFSFTASGGYFPVAAMILASNGLFYGMTYRGGSTNQGVIFEYDGAGGYQKKFDFDPDVSGANSLAGLTEAGGKLYGVATYLGPAGNGTLFEFNQTTSTFTKKLDFSNALGGSNPVNGLATAPNNMLYGTTSTGGVNGMGTIYEVNPSLPALSNLTKKVDFSFADGTAPSSALTLASNGKFYGVASGGGANGDGTLYEYDPGTTSITNKFSFSSATSGRIPLGTLSVASNGKLYGTTKDGGPGGAGTIFEFDPTTGAVANMFYFSGGNTGANPNGGLVLAANGKLYGMTNFGGVSDKGILYEFDILAGGTFTKKFEFSGTNGTFPFGELMQASNGKLYGLASGGGSNGDGVLFEYDYTAAAYTVKFNFTAAATGSIPKGSLSETSNGVFFGTTSAGGTGGKGVFFKYDLAGGYTVMQPLGLALGAEPQFGAPLLVPAKQSQTITFNSLPTHQVNDVFTLTATASSALAVSYTSSNPSVASISGSTVTVHTPGTITITASQGGNASFTFAQNVVQTLTVAKATQTISFTLSSPVTYGSGTISLNGTASSGLTVTYLISDPTVASITGTTLTILKAAPGGITITAQQAGDALYDPAPDVPHTLIINKASQSITFAPPATPQTYGNTFTINVLASSGLPLTFSASPAIVSVSGAGPTYTVTILGPSNQATTITASQAGNGNYDPAADAQGVVFINKASQTMTFGPLATKTYGDPAFNLTGSSTSGLALSYASSDATVASISGNTVTILKAGTTQITPSQAGDANYLPAAPIGPPIYQVLTVNKATQTITFGTLPVKSTSDPDFNLTATTNSTSPVTYSSDNTLVATIVNGNLVHIVGAGSANITANAAADVNYLVANPVVQNLVVTTKLSQTITFNAIPSRKFGLGNFTLTAIASSSLPVSYVSGNTSVATVSGSTVTIVGVGTTTITASQAGDATYNPATPVDQNLVVTKGDQTITFQITSNPVVGGTFTLAGTSSSGLTVTYQVTSGGASISGTTVTGVTAGNATIRASQAGNANYNAAPDVNATFCVRPVQPTITATGSTLTSSSPVNNFWALNGGSIGGTTQSITVATSGNYTVQVITGGCASDMSLPLVFTGDLAEPLTSFIVYPNPARDKIMVDLHEFLREPVELKIVDQKGQAVHNQKITGGDAVEIGISEHAAGLYIVFASQGERILKARYVKGQ